MARVNVSVPVYNGGEFLEECLACLKGQTFVDFRVVVFDNASTDNTRVIAEHFAETDRRFEVISRPKTIPPLENFQDAVERADSEYFAWRAHDDLSAPTFLERLVELLDANPQASLAACEVRTYEEAKDRWRVYPTPKMPGNKMAIAPAQLLGAHASWIYGLYRRAR